MVPGSWVLPAMRPSHRYKLDSEGGSEQVSFPPEVGGQQLKMYSVTQSDRIPHERAVLPPQAFSHQCQGPSSGQPHPYSSARSSWTPALPPPPVSVQSLPSHLPPAPLPHALLPFPPSVCLAVNPHDVNCNLSVPLASLSTAHFTSTSAWPQVSA